MSAAVVDGGTCVARGDGRQPNQLRPLGCEVGVMARADGAARFSLGDSTVLATVTGPADISASREVSDRATIDVIWRAKSGSVSSIKVRRKEQQLSHVLEAIIISELHPRSSITLVVQEINNDGAYLSTAINASCMALMDAGVSLRYCCAAVELAIRPQGGLVLDPSAAEQKAAAANLCFVFTNSGKADGAMLLCESSGKHSYAQYEQAMQSARETSAILFAFYRKAAERRMRTD